MARSPISPATSAFRNKRLSVIAEDGSTLPAQARNQRNKPSNSSSPLQSQNASRTSFQTSHRPESRQWSDKPPHHSADASPPGYEHWNSDVRQSRWSRVMGNVRSNQQLTRRGGWRRLLIFAIVALLVIIALAVGLGVGLSQRNASPSSPPSGSTGGSSGGTTSGSIAGSYAIPVYSVNETAGCVSIPDTWFCYPGQTYAENSASSSATYKWTISPGDSTNPFYISAIADPFQDMFSNIALTLQNAGTADEYYVFETNINKTVVHVTDVPGLNGGVANCLFNNTILRGELYTQKPRLTNITTSDMSQEASAASGTWQPWPYAINVTQTAAGGPDTPNCYPLTAQGLGARIQGIATESSSTQCLCSWQNFGV